MTGELGAEFGHIKIRAGVTLRAHFLLLLLSSHTFSAPMDAQSLLFSHSD